MGLLDDILKALDRIPVWKRLQDTPGEIDDLKARVATLEEKLGGKWPADTCKYCGARALRLARSSADGNSWECLECYEREFRKH